MEEDACVYAHSNWNITRDTAGDPASEERE